MERGAEIVMFIAISIIQLIILWNVIENGQRLDDLDKLRNKLYDDANKQVKNSTGVYFQEDDYYCVDVKNRNPLNIKRTEAHELCHAFIDEKKEHFCRCAKPPKAY